MALRATGQLIGDCAAMPRAGDPGQCEIGFTIAPRYQGRGYATEAVRLLVGYLFARGKHRITACCDARNAASAAVLERLGMRREGHLRHDPPVAACVDTQERLERAPSALAVGAFGAAAVNPPECRHLFALITVCVEANPCHT